MTRKVFHPVAMAALLLVGGCASTTPFAADVTRFHLGQSIDRGTVHVSLAPATAPAPLNESLEARGYVAALSAALQRAGFTPVETADAATYLATVDISQTARTGPKSGSPVRIGVGGGSWGGNVGVGVGTSFGVGKGKQQDILTSLLALRLVRKADNTAVWEGRAIAESLSGKPDSGLGSLVPKLADALLTGFPGESGKTVRLPAR